MELFIRALVGLREVMARDPDLADVEAEMDLGARRVRVRARDGSWWADAPISPALAPRDDGEASKMALAIIRALVRRSRPPKA